jgi:hypothetical protein
MAFPISGPCTRAPVCEACHQPVRKVEVVVLDGKPIFVLTCHGVTQRVHLGDRLTTEADWPSATPVVDLPRPPPSLGAKLKKTLGGGR